MKGTMIASAVAASVIFSSADALAVASDSKHFKDAVMHLQNGDIANAEYSLFGQSNARHSECFYADLIDKKLEKVAVIFEIYYYEHVTGIDNWLNTNENSLLNPLRGK
jgi:hypothetical protein